LELDANRERKLELKYVESKMGAKVELEIRRVPTTFPAAVELARKADAVILSVGYSPATEHEGRDRTFALPTGQDALIRAVADANPNAIVVVNSGGNADMAKWIGKVKALLMAWYPGRNGNTALAEILAGDVSPSGKLPMTFEKKWEDNPCHDSYYENTPEKWHVKYKEGIFVGYRGYDENNVEPRFPFGFGLSYTTFKYGALRIEKRNGGVAVSFDITNTGKRRGAEIAQIYVRDIKSSVPRPPKELKGFERVELDPGETRRVETFLPADAFKFYDVGSKTWKLEPGYFEIMVASSSRDVRLREKTWLGEKTTSP
jgi:beta-glucosidase